MANNPRDTRCISAAFEFLSTAEFCQRCTVPGDRKHRLDSDSDTNTSCDGMLPEGAIKKSESDTALLQARFQDGREGEEEEEVRSRVVVCLCAERDRSCDLHHQGFSGGSGRKGSDFLQGYIDRYAAGTGDSDDDDDDDGDGDLDSGGVSGRRVGETDIAVARKRLEGRGGCLNGDGRDAGPDHSRVNGNGDVNSCPPSGGRGSGRGGHCVHTARVEERAARALRVPDSASVGGLDPTHGGVTSHYETPENDTHHHQPGINSTTTTTNSTTITTNNSTTSTTSTTTTSDINERETGSSTTNYIEAQGAVPLLRSTNGVSGEQESCKEPSIPAWQENQNGNDVVPGESCATTTRAIPGTRPEKRTEEKEKKKKEEVIEVGDEDDVVMRPNRHMLNRRSTDTGFISSAFDFLLPAAADSVFLPLNGDGGDDAGSARGCVPSSATDCTTKNGADRKAGTNEKATREDQNCGTRDEGVMPGKTKEEEEEEEEGGSTGSGSTGSDSTGSFRLRQRHLSKQDSITEEDGSGDSSDEDAGVYAESFRRSNWIRIDDNGELELAFPAVTNARLSSASRSSAASRSSGTSRSSSWSADTTDCGRAPSPKVSSSDEPVQSSGGSGQSSPRLYLFHKRSDSTSTTLSEGEFKKEYVTRRKCLIKRQNSSKEYHRFSASVYEEEKSVILEKVLGEQDFGLHILDSQPAYITRVDPGSAAHRVGVEEGQILVSVNGTNVLSSSHDDIVTLIMNSPAVIKVSVATSDFQPSRDLQAALIEGHMQKLGGASSIMRRWKRRYFVLRQDSCLYYYKQKDDSDPLGAIPLAGYTFSRHLDSGRDYCFKAEKYGARTYYFMTDSRDIMTEWVGALSEAAARSKNRKESFVSVSSHNVGLPALDIRRPECSGYLLKVGNRRKTWHRRYCVLKDACLYYYKNMNSLSALGVAHLHGYKVDPFPTISKRHAFAVLPSTEGLRTFKFSAENETDRERWVTAMIRSIQRWIQIDNDC